MRWALAFQSDVARAFCSVLLLSHIAFVSPPSANCDSKSIARQEIPVELHAADPEVRSLIDTATDKLESDDLQGALKLAAGGIVFAQKAPSIPDRPWDSSLAKPSLKAPSRLFPAPTLDPAKIYTLSELVNIAEQNNPETRVAWENAKARAAEVGIAQATLYPTLAAAALAESTRADVFFGNSFQQQTVDTLSPILQLDYIIFDFGQRSQEIAAS